MGETIPADGELEINAGRRLIELVVASNGACEITPALLPLPQPAPAPAGFGSGGGLALEPSLAPPRTLSNASTLNDGPFSPESGSASSAIDGFADFDGPFGASPTPSVLFPWSSSRTAPSRTPWRAWSRGGRPGDPEGEAAPGLHLLVPWARPADQGTREAVSDPLQGDPSCWCPPPRRRPG